jgi:hypothetical protein
VVIETFKALRNMTSDEADPDKFIVGQEPTSSGIVDDADQKVNSKDDTMQLLTKLLGDYTTGDVSVDNWFIPKQFKAKVKGDMLTGILIRLQDVDEPEEKVRLESDFEDGLDFYQISFDEVDGMDEAKTSPIPDECAGLLKI